VTPPYAIAHAVPEFIWGMSVGISALLFINHRLGIRRPSGPPFNINSLVDPLSWQVE
jgi:hypothetical protein